MTGGGGERRVMHNGDGRGGERRNGEVRGGERRGQGSETDWRTHYEYRSVFVLYLCQFGAKSRLSTARRSRNANPSFLNGTSREQHDPFCQFTHIKCQCLLFHPARTRGRTSKKKSTKKKHILASDIRRMIWYDLELASDIRRMIWYDLELVCMSESCTSDIRRMILSLHLELLRYASLLLDRLRYAFHVPPLLHLSWYPLNRTLSSCKLLLVNKKCCGDHR